MRFFLISLLSLFFLSGCEEKDPAEEFIGKWSQVGDSSTGYVFMKDGEGIRYSEGNQRPFKWEGGKGVVKIRYNWGTVWETVKEAKVKGDMLVFSASGTVLEKAND